MCKLLVLVLVIVHVASAIATGTPSHAQLHHHRDRAVKAVSDFNKGTIAAWFDVLHVHTRQQQRKAQAIQDPEMDLEMMFPTSYMKKIFDAMYHVLEGSVVSESMELDQDDLALSDVYKLLPLLQQLPPVRRVRFTGYYARIQSKLRL
jgi:hypothetical protein